MACKGFLMIGAELLAVVVYLYAYLATSCPALAKQIVAMPFVTVQFLVIISQVF